MEWGLVTGVKYYDLTYQEYLWLQGSKAASLALWTNPLSLPSIPESPVFVGVEIQGIQVSYRHYTHNGDQIGDRPLQFYFD